MRPPYLPSGSPPAFFSVPLLLQRMILTSSVPAMRHSLLLLYHAVQAERMHDYPSSRTASSKEFFNLLLHRLCPALRRRQSSGQSPSTSILRVDECRWVESVFDELAFERTNFSGYALALLPAHTNCGPVCKHQRDAGTFGQSCSPLDHLRSEIETGLGQKRIVHRGPPKRVSFGHISLHLSITPSPAMTDSSA
jgi:hypothetical protein